MGYSCDVFACVSIVSLAIGMPIGLLLRSEEETRDCVRWVRPYVRQGFQVAFDGVIFILRMAVCMVVGAFCCSVAPCVLCIPPCLLGLASMKAVACIMEACLPRRTALAKKTWAPAENKRTRRKRQLRVQRHTKQQHRLRVRFEREVRAEYGAVIAWFFKPRVYRSMVKVLYVVHFLGWCRFIVFVLMTTRALFAYARVVGILFYTCCVLALPFLPSTHLALCLFATVVASSQKGQSRAEAASQQSVESSVSTLTPRSRILSLKLQVKKPCCLDIRRREEERRWRDLMEPWRKRMRERSARRAAAKKLRRTGWMMRPMLYAKFATGSYQEHGLQGPGQPSETEPLISDKDGASESSGLVVVEEPAIPNIVAHVQGAEPLHASISSDSSGLVVMLEPVISDIGAHVQGSEPLHDTAADLACDPEPCSWQWKLHLDFLSGSAIETEAHTGAPRTEVCTKRGEKERDAMCQPLREGAPVDGDQNARPRGGGLDDDVYCVGEGTAANPALLQGIDLPAEPPAESCIRNAVQCTRIHGNIDGVLHIAACTCGDGACALHAVWGRADPSRHMDLFARKGRRAVLEEVPENALAVSGLFQGQLCQEFQALMDTVWKNLVLPAAFAVVDDKSWPSREAGIAWAATASRLQGAILHFAAQRRQEDAQQLVQSTALQEFAAEIFKPEYEADVIRPLWHSARLSPPYRRDGEPTRKNPLLLQACSNTRGRLERWSSCTRALTSRNARSTRCSSIHPHASTSIVSPSLRIQSTIATWASRSGS